MTTTDNEPATEKRCRICRQAHWRAPVGWIADHTSEPVDMPVAAERAIGADEIPDHVVDRDGLVWRIVRDGGMATRADYEGITTIGIYALRDDHGPLHPVARLTRERSGQ